ncbi:MAG: DUF4384 domain-containing protein [Alphaproteobacteria bacterium]|nr:DUF4384 domain-containing protein [Alphaproteobacteria bacterium]
MGRRVAGALPAGALAASMALAACGGLGPSEELTAAQKDIAEVKIGPPAAAKADTDAAASTASSRLAIAGWADHPARTYRPGEKITLSLRVSEDAFVAVLQVLRNGETTLLFPNKYQPKAAVAANTVLQIPGPGDPYEILAPASGPELIEFIAAATGGSWLFNRTPTGSAYFASLGFTTRSLAKEIAESVKSKKGETSAARQSLVLRVE